MTPDIPFRGSVAVADGTVTWDQLRGPHFDRLAPDTYVAAEVPPTLRRLLLALHCWRPDAVIGGLAAASVWCDADTDANDDTDTDTDANTRTTPAFRGLGGELVHEVDLVVPGRTRPVPGVRLRRDALPTVDVGSHGGLPVTSPPRTILDVLRRCPREVAVVVGDAVSARHGVALADVAERLADRSWERGVDAARCVLPLLDSRSRTPVVSRIRLALVDRRIPVPQVGGVIVEGGDLLSWPDLCWPEMRYAVLCGGLGADESHAADEVRLRAAGWRVWRVPDAAASDPAGVAQAIHWGLRAALRCRRR